MAVAQRKIIHVDMDCFYAAVEVKHRPELKGKPLGIGGPPNSRSVLCTASYEARKFGVRSAMPSSRAVKLCPQLILVPPNFTLYKAESAAVRDIFRRFTDIIEPLSLDEAYLDVTDAIPAGGSATAIAMEIRSCIEKELRLTASAGIAPNKFLAKIASDWKKPNGQFVIKPGDIAAFMPPLKVEKLFGVGKVTAQKMHDLNLRTCGDIQKCPLQDLTRWFGSRAQDLKAMAFGIDHRPVQTHGERKSLTVEETFNKDLITLEQWLKPVSEIYLDWESRMTKYAERTRIRGWVVKVKFTDFKNMTRETASREWPSVKNFENLFRDIWRKRPEPIRLLGLGARLGSTSSRSSLDDVQLTLGEF